MIPRIRVANAAKDDPTARAAVDAVNVAIGQIEAEGAQIDRDAAVIIADACEADPTDAPKLVKRVEALRVRRLANILRELQIVPMKQAVEPIVRQACATAAARWSEALVQHETLLTEAANNLGMPENSRQRTALFVGDENRRSLLAAIADANGASCNWFARCKADSERVEELRGMLATMLR